MAIRIPNVHRNEGPSISAEKKYGTYFWCVRISKEEEVYVHADVAEVLNGTLLFARKRKNTKTGRDEMQFNLAFASGHWEAFYAASVVDGGPIAVAHWRRNGHELAKMGFSQKPPISP
jgi:hypothetical protein